MRMKILSVFLVLLAFTCFAATRAHADPIVSLNVLDNHIEVGESFAVEVWVDGDSIVEELLAFGFDVTDGAPNFSFSSHALGDGFDDADSSDVYIGGIAFEGLAANFVRLATLNFTAGALGTNTLSIVGILDMAAYGLYYVESSFDIYASTEVTIRSSSNGALPEPGTMVLLISALAGVAALRGRDTSAA